MNIVLTEAACDIAGVKVPDYVRTCAHRNLGQQLRVRMESEQALDYAGDCKVTDAWATELGLERWFEWVLLDSDLAV